MCPPKKQMNSTLSDDISSKLPELAEKVLFVPTDVQQKIKAKFWTRFTPGPLVSEENISLSKALEITDCPKIRDWWHRPGFREWLLNKNEEQERVKYLFNKGLDAIESILDNPDVKTINAKANIIKMLAEMNGYLGKRPIEKFADEDINKMSEHQLRSFLERKGVKIIEEKVLNVNNKDDDKAET